MAKQVGGILGPVRGKVSNVVGARWKETPYYRAYAIPANPRTEAQQNQRAKMVECVWVAKALLGSVINPYWDPFSKNMAGYNRFCQVNLKLVGSPPNHLLMLVSEGKLEPTYEIETATYDSGLSYVSIAWGTSCMGNGLPTDLLIACILDVEHKVAFFNLTGIARSVGSTTVTVGTERSRTYLKAFVSFYRSAGSTLMVSPSKSLQVGAP